MNHLYNVMTKKNKDVLFNIRIRKDIRAKFAVAAELKGSSSSGLLHQYIRDVIVEAERDQPDEFQKAFEEYLAEEEKKKLESEKPKELAPNSKSKITLVNPNEEIEDKDEGLSKAG